MKVQFVRLSGNPCRTKVPQSEGYPYPANGDKTGKRFGAIIFRMLEASCLRKESAGRQ